MDAIRDDPSSVANVCGQNTDIDGQIPTFRTHDCPSEVNQYIHPRWSWLSAEGHDPDYCKSYTDTHLFLFNWLFLQNARVLLILIQNTEGVKSDPTSTVIVKLGLFDCI